MAKISRDRGANFEREQAPWWGLFLRRIVKRRLGQARDGGHDLEGTEPIRVECKRVKRSATLYGWMRQVEKGAEPEEIPVVCMRADGETPLLIMRLYDVQKLIDAVPPMQKQGLQLSLDGIL